MGILLSAVNLRISTHIDELSFICGLYLPGEARARIFWSRQRVSLLWKCDCIFGWNILNLFWGGNLTGFSRFVCLCNSKWLRSLQVVTLIAKHAKNESIFYWLRPLENLKDLFFIDCFNKISKNFFSYRLFWKVVYCLLVS